MAQTTLFNMHVSTAEAPQHNTVIHGTPQEAFYASPTVLSPLLEYRTTAKDPAPSEAVR